MKSRRREEACLAQLVADLHWREACVASGPACSSSCAVLGGIREGTASVLRALPEKEDFSTPPVSQERHSSSPVHLLRAQFCSFIDTY